jgi:hypothetical protein
MTRWRWCPGCERCYPDTMQHWIDGLPLCHYEDCSTSALSSWDWERARNFLLNAPRLPVLGVTYPRIHRGDD